MNDRKFDWPLDSNQIRRGVVNNTFGMVRRNLVGLKKPHQGWDLYAEAGTPFYAVGDGKIVARRDGGDYGLTLVQSIDLGGRTLYVAYSHLGATQSKVGDQVKLGQFLGFTGNSGNAKGMKGKDQHLHLELRDMPTPGLGLVGRLSPIKLFGVCPMAEPVKRWGAR